MKTQVDNSQKHSLAYLLYFVIWLFLFLFSFFNFMFFYLFILFFLFPFIPLFFSLFSFSLPKPEVVKDDISSETEQVPVEQEVPSLSTLRLSLSEGDIGKKQNELVDIVTQLDSNDSEITKWTKWFARQTVKYLDSELSVNSYSLILNEFENFLKEKKENR